MLTMTNGMLLYHGSFTQVSDIDLNKCNQGKDFGRGFCNEKAIQTLEFIRSERYDFNHI